MIELVTGLPGHGKTLLTIAKYRDLSEKTGRQIFYSGIKGLNLPWQEWDPKKWEELPPNSILIIDEAQFVFPIRGRGQPEEWIERLAVHRHSGKDIVLITQNPMGIDSFVRRLVERHLHVIRKFGTHSATVHEFVTGVKEEVAKSRDGSIRHEVRYPKDVFALYKSAEVHTVKARVPVRVWLLLALPVIIFALGYTFYARMNPEAVKAQVTGQKAEGARPAVGNQASPVQAPPQSFDLVAAYAPRIPDLPHTAPVYDEVTKPEEAPRPAACVASATKCKCYTQQATALAMSDATCLAIVAGGFFTAWRDAKGGETSRANVPEVKPAMIKTNASPPASFSFKP